AQFTLAILGGVAFAILAGLLERRARARGAPGRARAWTAMGLAAVLLAVFALEMALLWPVLGSNYRGLRPALARWAAAAGLLVPLALYGVVTVWLSRSLTGAAPATEPASAEPAASSDPSSRPLTRRAALAGAGTIVLGFVGAWLARGLTRRATFGSFGYDGMQTKGPN